MKPKENYKGDPLRDRCQTPPYAILPLVPYLNLEWTIWEPAAGEGLLVAALRQHGFRVVGTDILTGHDFFRHTEECDAVVTNPPFSLKFEWHEHCNSLGKPYALLVPVEMLGSATAQRQFRKHGCEIILMDKRVDFKMPQVGWKGGGAQYPVMWLTNGLNIGRQLTFAKLDKPNAQRRAEMIAGVEQLVLGLEIP